MTEALPVSELEPGDVIVLNHENIHEFETWLGERLYRDMNGAQWSGWSEKRSLLLPQIPFGARYHITATVLDRPYSRLREAHRQGAIFRNHPGYNSPVEFIKDDTFTEDVGASFIGFVFQATHIRADGSNGEQTRFMAWYGLIPEAYVAQLDRPADARRRSVSYTVTRSLAGNVIRRYVEEINNPKLRVPTPEARRWLAFVAMRDARQPRAGLQEIDPEQSS